MAHLDVAAAFERRYAAVAVYALAGALIALTLVLKGPWSRFIAVLGALFPLCFIADSFFWLYRFGHELDPRAPLHLPQFTPQLFGNGTIGQFMTFATPQSGFWLAVAGVALLFGPVILLGGAATKRQSTKRRSIAARGYAARARCVQRMPESASSRRDARCAGEPACRCGRRWTGRGQHTGRGASGRNGGRTRSLARGSSRAHRDLVARTPLPG
jgi:hypothetical protein